MLDKVRRGFGWVTRTAMLVCGVSVALMMGYGFADVSARFLFNHPLPGTFELSGLLMVVVVYLSLASCQAEGRHMRVDFLFGIMSTPVRAGVDRMAYACGMLVCGLFAWCAAGPAWYSWKIREVSMGIIPFPVYPSKFIVVVGATLLALQHLLDLLGTILGSGKAK